MVNASNAFRVLTSNWTTVELKLYDMEGADRNDNPSNWTTVELKSAGELSGTDGSGLLIGLQ